MFWFADQCGGRLEATDVAQFLTYPFSSSNYANNQFCSWILTSGGSASRIRITFVRFSTESSHDILTVSCHFI